jgi:hypothetical protein
LERWKAQVANPEQILEWVNSEFGEKAKLFTPVEIRLNNRKCKEFEAMKVPGVYVFLHEDVCIKVGKSHSNASKRALQHCGADNTSSADKKWKMSELLDDHRTLLLVYALNQPDSMHWVLALENFLERKLQPAIPSKRNG